MAINTEFEKSGVFLELKMKQNFFMNKHEKTSENCGSCWKMAEQTGKWRNKLENGGN